MLQSATFAEAILTDDSSAERAAPARFRETRVAPPPEQPVLERHGYQPSGSSRLAGGVGTIAIVAMILIGGVIGLAESARHKAAPAKLSVTLVPLVDASKPAPAKVEPQKPVERPKTPVQQAQAIVTPPPIVQIPVAVQVPVVTETHPVIEPKPVEVAPPAPPPPAAPSAPSHASKGADRWAGKVIARIEQVRRYPSEARNARQQGTVLVRFKMERGGHVLSSSIVRSSGNAALDQAALEAVRNADPLPKIPADRPDQVQLEFAVEFALNR